MTFKVSNISWNLYANDLQDCLKNGSTCFLYADDTAALLHAPPKDLEDCVNRMNNILQSIESWAADSNLLLNETNSKQMFLTTRQMSRVHDVGDYTPPLSLKNKLVDRVDRFRLLGTFLSEDLLRSSLKSGLSMLIMWHHRALECLQFWEKSRTWHLRKQRSHWFKVSYCPS